MLNTNLKQNLYQLALLLLIISPVLCTALLAKLFPTFEDDIGFVYIFSVLTIPIVAFVSAVGMLMVKRGPKHKLYSLLAFFIPALAVWLYLFNMVSTHS